jgi:hypothetical protein
VTSGGGVDRACRQLVKRCKWKFRNVTSQPACACTDHHYSFVFTHLFSCSSGYGSNHTPLSPVHIPSDGDADEFDDMDSDMDTEDLDYMPGTPPPQDLLGLGDNDEGTPSLSGFNLQIQELE